MEYELQLTQNKDHCRVRFPAMASLCEILIDSQDTQLALKLGHLARDEAQRIEQKFSRYRDDNIVAQINTSDGKSISVDEEMALMLSFATTLWELSEGRFDITSGVLRTVWTFDGSDRLPTQQQVAEVKQRVGWEKVQWQAPSLTLPAGMEIDLGGIGKEYAVDKVSELLNQHWQGSVLVNFGGDLRCNLARQSGSGWHVGIEKVHADEAQTFIELKEGGLATSGDQRRFLQKDNVRYSHILDPRTGWPITGAPHSITAIAPTCLQAGMFSSLAMLMGSDAESFLNEQDVRFWSIR